MPGLTNFNGQTSGVGVGVLVGVKTGVKVKVGGSVLVTVGVSVGVGVLVGVLVGVGDGPGVLVGVIVGVVQSPSKKQLGAGEDARNRSNPASLAASAINPGLNPPKKGPSQLQALYSAFILELASPSTIDAPNRIAN